MRAQKYVTALGRRRARVRRSNNEGGKVFHRLMRMTQKKFACNPLFLSALLRASQQNLDKEHAQDDYELLFISGIDGVERILDMRKSSFRRVLVWTCLAFIFSVGGGQASEPLASNVTKPLMSDVTSFVYFTGIGCPHCANVDPVLLKQKIRQGNLLVIEYEIYRDNANAPLLMAYDKQFDTGLGVPMVVTEGKKGGAVVGDTPILESLDSLIAKHKGNGVVLPAGARSFMSLPLADLPRMPKIWFKDRVAVRKDMASQESDAIKAFVVDGTEPQGCAPSAEKEVALSDDKVVFAKACAFNGWLLLRD